MLLAPRPPLGANRPDRLAGGNAFQGTQTANQVACGKGGEATVLSSIVITAADPSLAERLKRSHENRKKRAGRRFVR
jgi:hypothetical protein